MQGSKKDTDVHSGLLDSEEEGEGGMIWENSIETCTLSCKYRIASLCPMQDTACLGLVTGMTQRDVMGREVGGGSCLGMHVHPWWIHVNVWQNQFKKIKKKKDNPIQKK